MEQEEGMTRRASEASTVPCGKCGARDAIQIEITLPDESDVTFNSCHRCEHRWWEAGSGVIDLTAVLEKARRR